MSDTATKNKNLSAKFWPLWLIFALLYVITRLPLKYQQHVGRVLGKLLYWFGPGRRHIAETNLRLCLPELSNQERQSLLKRHFSLYGISLIESFAAWWAKPAIFVGKVEYHGLHNLHEALKKGKGVLLLGSHFTTLEIGVRLLSQQIPFHAMYRRHKNPVFESIMSSGRSRWLGKVIDRRNIRGILRSLKENHPVWYGPDQDYGRKHSVFVPFMGNLAATVTGTSRLARLSGAAVVPYFVERTDDNGYLVIVHPALDNFPTDNIESDAMRINQIIEKQIRKAPENYLWTHRRFKTRPEGEPRPY